MQNNFIIRLSVNFREAIMKNKKLIISILLMTIASITRAYDFEGTYYGESGIDKLEITKNSVHGYGKCSPRSCDWGNSTKINYYSDRNMLVAEFKPIGDSKQKLYSTIIITPTAQKDTISVSAVSYWKSESQITIDAKNVMTTQEYLTK